MAPISFFCSDFVTLRKRQDDGGQSSQPFWISVVACVVLLILVGSLAFIAYSCIKAKRRRLVDQKAREADSTPSEDSPEMVHSEGKVQEHDRPIGSQLPVAPPVPATPDKPRHGYTGGNHHKNLTWKERAASLGQKSVRSVQWVSFRSSMDRRPAQPSTEWVVVNKDKDEKEGQD